MNKKILLALLGLALGSCGGTPTSSSASPAGSSDTQSTPASDSSSAPSSSDSSFTPSSSDSSVTPSSSDSGQTPSSSDSGQTPSSSDSGSDTSSGTGTGGTDVLTEERKEKIIDFLTKDNGGLTEGNFVADVDILTPLQLGATQCQNILRFQNMTVLYNVSDKKVYNGIWGAMGVSIGVGKGIAAYEELSKMMGQGMPPVPEGIDVKTEDGAIAYCKYFFEFMYSQSGQETTFNCEKKAIIIPFPRTK